MKRTTKIACSALALVFGFIVAAANTAYGYTKQSATKIQGENCGTDGGILKK